MKHSDFHRFRKYQRKKDRARGTGKFDRLACLYWRYWFKRYGAHEPLWR
jgi:hypothetical protein